MSLVEMSHADYLKHPAYGSSDIIKMRRSFAYWQFKKANPEPKSRPLVIGSAVHLILQAELSNNLPLAERGLAVYKDGSSLTKGFKTFQAERPDLYCLDQDEQALCVRVVKALLDEREVMRYLKDAIPEATVMRDYPGTSIPFKVRPDYLHKGLGVSINIKTAADASESGFIYSARDYGYDWQSAAYCDVLTEEFGKSFDEIHVLVEKGDAAEECEVSIFTFGDDTLSWARHQIRELLAAIPACEKSGKWPRKNLHLERVDLPPHMRKLVTL